MVEKVKIELDRIDLGVVALLLDRLPRQAENVERDGHLNAARYMRTAAQLCEIILEEAKRNVARCTCAAIVNPNIPHARGCPLYSE